MKKSILVFIIFILFIPFSIKAKEVNDISCTYQIKCKDPVYNKIVDLGYYQIMYTGYNDGNYSNGKVYLFYGEDFDTSSYRSINPASKFKEYKNYGFSDQKRNMYILHGESNGQEFAKKFKISNDCPTMYCAVNSSDIYLNTVSNYTSGYLTSTNALSAGELLLRNSQTKSWEKKNNFYSNNGSSTAKEPLVCEYSITPQGEYYDEGLNTSIKAETANITLTTTYDPNTSEAQSYNININGFGPNGPITSLNSEVSFPFTGNQSFENYMFYVSKEQLKKIFAGSCLDKDKIFIYLHKNKVNMGVLGYVLTTNELEVKDNLLDEDFTHNNTGKGGSKEDVDLNFGGSKTCEQILGKVLTKVVKSGITIMQIICAIIAIVKGMMILVPAVMAKDADALKKASRTLMMMGIILAIVIIFRPVIRLLGSLLDFDVSCIL